MTTYIVRPAHKPLLGYARVPGDKSIAHRALLFGALASGTVRVRGVGAGADNGRSARAMTALGARIERGQGEIVIHGVGLDGLRTPSEPVDCGNSGTTIRLLTGLLAGQRFATTMVGDESLAGRPMRRVTDPLAQMGAVIRGQAGAKPGDVYPPLTVGPAPGPLTAIDYALPMASAQVKSAVLLAGLYADGVTRVREPSRSRDHTERMLARMGAPITVAADGAIELDTRGWDRQLAADSVDVPADPSQAAFILAAGLVAGVERITVGEVCVNPTRTGFVDVLALMGALVERESMSGPRGDIAGEPTADLSISRPGSRPGSSAGGAAFALSGTTVSGELTVRAIDEIPLLAVVAARAHGATRFADAAELRVKESDRIATTCAMLRAFGIDTEEEPDGFTVHGAPDRPLKSARVHAHGDHRIAMSAAIAGLVADGPVTIDGAESVDTSFPTFVEVLRSLGADIAVAEG